MGSIPDTSNRNRRFNLDTGRPIFPRSSANGIARAGVMVMALPALDFMPVVQDALERGQVVRMTVRGSSMFPFIRGDDAVALEPPGATPAVGDIVLARCAPESRTERYVLHRVVRSKGGKVFLRGDSQKDCEGPFAREDILGRAILVYRNGRARRLDRGVYRTLGLAWNRCAPLNLWLFQIIRRLREKWA